MMRVAYFDCFAGISGDMTLGALLDAGLLVADLQRALNGLKVPGWRLDVARVTKQGIAGTQVKVLVDETADLPHRHLESQGSRFVSQRQHCRLRRHVPLP